MKVASTVTTLTAAFTGFLPLSHAKVARVGAWASSNTIGPEITPENAEAAIGAMNGFYNQTDGRWDTNAAWWISGGGALQTMLDYMQQTGSRKYLDQAMHTIELQREPLPWWPQGGGDFRADSTDDTGWWALAMVRMFDLTSDVQYLDIAKEDEAYMFSYWNTSTCGGGMIQQINTMEYKNAISNELYFKLAASLHNRIPGDTEYLQRAQMAWDWFRGSGMINSANLVNDGLAENVDGTCSNNGGPTYTYNQGVILGGLSELYRAVADESYLQTARQVADAVISSPALSPNRILTEPCGGGCDDNAPTFKGIFIRNLAELANTTGEQTYRDYIVKNAQTAWAQDRNSTNFFDFDWAGPFKNTTIGSQSSAVSLLVAAL